MTRELGTRFPHAYILLQGKLDGSGEKIEANYGFTATRISPAILLGAVDGEIMSVDADYIARSDRHFTLTLSDSEYHRVMATVDRWRRLRQPSYDLDEQNCVYFVAHVAATLGMKAATPKNLMKKPHRYVASLAAANRTWLARR
ncbi:MAG: hypothetical protein ACFBQW_05305 [Sphingomonadaceae bacterium]